MAREHQGVDVMRDAPGWLVPAIAAGMVVTAVAATATAVPGHRLPYGAAVFVAALPFVLDLSPRTSPPQAVSVAVILGGLAVAQVGGAWWGWIDDDLDTQVALLIGVFLVVETFAASTIRLALLSFAGTLAIMLGRNAVDHYLLSGIVWPGALLFGVANGLLIRRLASALEQRDAAQAGLEAAAVQAERRRIARDVHDLVAHSMTVSMLHITAARMALGRGDTAAAIEALEEAETAGRSSLRDVRTTVGLLREEGDSALGAAQPDTGDIDELVGAWQQAGLPVELRREGDCSGLDAGAGLALYRVAQEALANVARHLPGASSTVTLTRATTSVDLVVSSTGAMPGPVGDGHGLVGMRERVSAVGGHVAAGPTEDGWRVEASVPAVAASPARAVLG